MNEVVIVSGKRSAIGSFGGSLKNISAVELAEQVINGLLTELGLGADKVDELIVGNVLSAGTGQNIARQIGLKTGMTHASTAFTVNQVCGSGLSAIQLGIQSILLGDKEIVIAGGTESMSQAPYVLHDDRWGKKMGHSRVLDTLLTDGLTDAFSNEHMGITAETIATAYGITREEQDEFALKSQQKAEQALQKGRFTDEIIPITLTNKGKTSDFTTDEHPRVGINLDDLGRLKPVFTNQGSVTAGNASGINDGAAFVLLMTRKKAMELRLPSLGTVVSYATAGVDPAKMGIGPVPASLKALNKASLNIDDMDLIEANEAFASQSLAVQRELGIAEEKLNVNGGAIALGHPIGSSGARVLVSLLHEMKKQQVTYGLATLCIGGGQGISLIVKRD